MGLLYYTANFTTAEDWTRFTHVTETRRLFVLHRPGRGDNIWPLAKRAIGTMQQVAAVRELLLANLGNRSPRGAKRGFAVVAKRTSGSAPHAHEM